MGDETEHDRILTEVSRKLRECREPKRWMTARGLAGYLKRSCAVSVEVTDLEEWLIQEATTPTGHGLRYSYYPSRRTLDQLFGHVDVVGAQAHLPDLMRTDEPADVEAVELSVDAPIVFVSHNSRDAKAVLELRRELGVRGIGTWISETEIDSGAEIARAVREAIQSCVGFVLYLTRNSLGSLWVSKELEQVASNKLAVFVDGSDPEFLELLQSYAHYGKGDPEFARRILETSAPRGRERWVERGLSVLDTLNELPDRFHCWPPLTKGVTAPEGRWSFESLSKYGNGGGFR